jgi:hypothetical protein
MTSVRRNALNQALFREVNERIRGIAEDDRSSRELAIICECGNTGCAAALTITVGAYEAVRSNPVLFVVAPEHDDPTVESVIAAHGDYVIVRNEGLASEIARSTSTR